MKTEQSRMALGDGKRETRPFVQYHRIITDRGSVYSVSGGRVQNREEIKQFITKLKTDKNYARATHHSYAARVEKAGQIWETKNDDGETGAGAVILRILQKEDVRDTLVVVTRWYGGIKLMADRFRYVQDATRYFTQRI